MINKMTMIKHTQLFSYSIIRNLLYLCIQYKKENYGNRTIKIIHYESTSYKCFSQ